LRESIHTTDDIHKVLAFSRAYGHHKEWFERPLLARYAFETFLHEQNNKNGLLDRLKSRREDQFKRSFLKRSYEARFHDTLTDEELAVLPSSVLFTMIEDDDCTPDEIKRARNAIATTRKGQHFPLNKTYYEQSAKGVRIERMAHDTVRRAIIDIISVTATMPSRWQARHDEAVKRIAHLLNNPAKAQDLVNFFQSCINQGAYFKEISEHLQRLKGTVDKSTMVNAIDAMRNAAARSKHDKVPDDLYRTKMEPLNDILTMLKSQTDDSVGDINSVIIKSQSPAITDLYNYDTVHCCALFPYNNKDGILGYLEDEHIMLLQYFTKGKRGLLNIYGVIICALCEDQQGNTILLVDSAEGDENWLSAMKNWQETYRQCIKALAKDSGAKGIFYGGNGGNAVPKLFINYIQSVGTVREHLVYIDAEHRYVVDDSNGLVLRKKNSVPRYLETFKNGWSGKASGYYEPMA
jgi:hypothetical protein